ncbi:hypothetical protein ACFVZ0_05145, partial [Streptomyces prasinus]
MTGTAVLDGFFVLVAVVGLVALTPRTGPTARPPALPRTGPGTGPDGLRLSTGATVRRPSRGGGGA